MTTCAPSATSSCSTSCDTSRFTSFSTSPVGPTAPGSLPPCPGSMTTLAPAMKSPTGGASRLQGVCTTPSPTTGRTMPLGDRYTPGTPDSGAGQRNFGCVVDVVVDDVVVVAVVDVVVVVGVADFDPPLHATSATTTTTK